MSNINNDKPNQWPKPNKSKRKILKIEDAPPELFPGRLFPFVFDVCHSAQVPLAFALPSLFVTLGAAIGQQVKIQPKKHDDKWTVSANLWGLLEAPPSSIKSTVNKRMVSPLVELEKDEKKKYASIHGKWLREKAIIECKIKALERKLKGLYSEEGQSDKASTLEKEISELRGQIDRNRPIQKRYIVTDSTVEALYETLSENPNGVLYSIDEICRLFANIEKRGNEGYRESFLEMWDGGTSNSPDRISRNAKCAENMCLSILGTTQPEKFSRFLVQSNRKYGSDGFLQRFQLMVSSPRLDFFDYVDEPSNADAKETYFSTVQKLTGVSSLFKDNKGKPIILKFSKEAQNTFKNWFTALEIRLKYENLSSSMQAQLGKYRSLMPTLALIYHLVEMVNGEGSQTVSEASTKKAIELCRYLESHAELILHRNEVEIDRKVEALKEEILNRDLLSKFSLREFKRKKSLRDNTDNTDTWLKALDEMEGIGWLKISTKGRSIKIEVNPKVFD